MVTLLIANNCTVESGSFGGDQLCALKTAYLFVDNQPDVDKVVMSMSPGNTLNFVWTKFIEKYNVKIVWDNFNPGDWTARWGAWDEWRKSRQITSNDGEVIKFDHYRELYLRIHGAQRQIALCGMERGLNRRNIFEYWYYGQEHVPDHCAGADWFDDTLCYHPPLTRERDVYIAPHCKTQGNATFTFEFWYDVVHHLVDNGVSVTVGYNNRFCDDLINHPLFHKHWGSHEEWFDQIAKHKIVACGNTGTGWVAAACGVPMITMEPHNSVMADHRYRECGLRNLVEVVDGYKLDEMGNDMRAVAMYVARRITEFVNQKVVMTTGCYDILHAGHVKHLKRARALGSKLIVALNSDSSVRNLKGPSRPINSVEARKKVLEELRCVDEVRVFSEDDATELIKEIKPDVLACGYGYTPETIVGREIVEEYGGKVVVTCTSEYEDEPSTTKTIARVFKSNDITEICRLATAYSVNPFDKLRLIAYQFLSVRHLDGDVADLGSYRGGSALVLRHLAEGKHLHLFDTWAGTPHDDPLCHHKVGEWSTSLEDCKAIVGQGEFTHYWKGVFPNVEPVDSPWWDQQLYCFVYVDMDTYQSTEDAIKFFWPLLQVGGKIMFDDYGWQPCAGVKVAVDDYFMDDMRTYNKKVFELQHACIVEKR